MLHLRIYLLEHDSVFFWIRDIRSMNKTSTVNLQASGLGIFLTLICSLPMPLLLKIFTICLTLSLTLNFSSHSMLTSLRCAHANDCSIRTCFLLSPLAADKKFYMIQDIRKIKETYMSNSLEQ
jgi:hypothetical protein